MGIFLQLFGVLLIVLGFVDFFAANLFGIDFTGVVWSPFGLGIGGAILSWIGGKMAPDDDDPD
ncbi:hypothetical protein M1N56_05600 [Dehalococcoidia bacterium]|nr:hypothetical protein [Dehalococcoidia bacterium]